MGIIIKKFGELFFKTLYNNFMEAQLNPHETQTKVWQKIKQGLRGGKLYADLQLDKVQSYEDYLALIPVCNYQFYAPYVELTLDQQKPGLFPGKVEAIGLTSGTSGAHKRIPYNKEMMAIFKNFRQKLGSIIYHDDPTLDLTRAIQFKYASVPAQSFVGQIPVGYASGIVVTQKRYFYNARSFPTPRVLHIQNWEQQIEEIIKEVRGRKIQLLNGVPSYMIHIFREILERTGKQKLIELWPEISTFVYMATPLDQYKQTLDALIGKRPNYYGAYAATEGPLGVEIKGKSCQAEYAFNLDMMLFSFSKEEAPEKVFGFNELQVGEEYLVNVGGPNGLLQYPMRDKIRILQVSPYPKFAFIGRLGTEMNLAGEKLSEEQLLQAVSLLKEKSGLSIEHFFVLPTQDEEQRPCYQWILFSDDQASKHSPTQLAQSLDQHLMDLSVDYREIKTKDQVIGDLKLKLLPATLARDYFHRYKHQGQFKMKTTFRDEVSFVNFWNATFPDVGPPHL